MSTPSNDYVCSVRSCSGVSLYEGDLGACMMLAHCIENFPQDYVMVEVYHSETCSVNYKGLSPYWKD